MFAKGPALTQLMVGKRSFAVVNVRDNCDIDYLSHVPIIAVKAVWGNWAVN